MPFIVNSVILVVAYLVAAKVGLVFGTVSSSATIFWPPGGIALAALLLGGIRYLPSVFLAAGITAMMVGASPFFALGFTVGNTLETYIGFYLLRRFNHLDLSLSRPRDLFQVILLGGLIPPIASATLGPLSLLGSGLVTPGILPDVMWQWWRANVLGIAFFTPIVLVFAGQKSKFLKLSKAWELMALWTASFVIGQSIFLGWKLPGVALDQPIVLTWIIPILVWAGLRTGRRNTALIQLMFMAQVLAGAYYKVGYFSDDFSRYGLSNFWMFAMLLAVSGMALAVLSTAQRRAAHLITLNAKVFAVSNDGIMIVDAENRIIEVNPAFTELTGYSHDEVLGRDPKLLSSGKQSPEFYSDMWKSLIETGYWNGELWSRRKDGEAFLEQLSIYTLKDKLGKVVNRIGVFSDVTQIRAEQETVAHQAQHDFLTNLPNRLLFRDRFKQQLARAKRHKKKFAVLYIDLDKFKPVNDTLGHQVGDQLLVAVAERLKLQVREIDTVSRFGGDEFAVLMSEVSTRNDVTTLADKILAALSLPYSIDGHAIHITGSMGIAIYPDDGRDMEIILSKADAAMYKAKHNGSNTYC
ncbi:MAG: diguanylate cyclase [Gammaproteobacteria bacterium]|nr:diguanylate cyclase [Gammaproteobacteria bacterium]MBU1480205.1 diguanylate cyclase [Gammaproteobacteria bacterium]